MWTFGLIILFMLVLVLHGLSRGSKWGLLTLLRSCRLLWWVAFLVAGTGSRAWATVVQFLGSEHGLNNCSFGLSYFMWDIFLDQGWTCVPSLALCLSTVLQGSPGLWFWTSPNLSQEGSQDLLMTPKGSHKIQWWRFWSCANTNDSYYLLDAYMTWAIC